MVEVLLSITFACGVIVAAAHVINRAFVAPVYDVLANLTAFSSAVAASSLLRHWVPASFAGVAVACWLVLAGRTVRAIRSGRPRTGQTPLAGSAAVGDDPGAVT